MSYYILLTAMSYWYYFYQYVLLLYHYISLYYPLSQHIVPYLSV